jgi:phosphoglycerate dehydrogenase-like enzyme
MSLHVHLISLYTTLALDELTSRLDPDVTVTVGQPPVPGGAAEPLDPDLAARVNVLVGGWVTHEQIAPCPRLRAVIVPFAGTPRETVAVLRSFPQVSLHSLHYNVAPTAEMAIALLLAAAKRIVPLDQELRRFDWRSRYGVTEATVLEGKTALVLGYGQIGKRIARACVGLGMQVIGVRRGEPELPGAVDEFGAAVYGAGALHSLLPRAHALLLVLPGTDETKGMVGAAELALLPPGAVLVNVGRGPTLDEEALWHALQRGHLRAAGLDVWWQYPDTMEERVGKPPSRFPFHELPNVVLSPHRAGWLSESEHDRMEGLAAMLNAANRGDPIPSPVDKTLGY